MNTGGTSPALHTVFLKINKFKGKKTYFIHCELFLPEHTLRCSESGTFLHKTVSS